MALLLLVIGLAAVIIGYQVYSKRVDREIIRSDPRRKTPAVMYQDNVDFMPASASVLFGYQFKSIAALGPIVGPIIAAQYGWLPAFLWIIIGFLFIGWIQDYASTMLSVRHDGMTLGGLSYKLISPRARFYLLSFLYIYLLLIMGAFGALIAPLLARPEVPIGFLLLTLAGVLAGQMVYRWRINMLATTVVTVALALIGIWLGTTPAAQNIVKAINGLAGDPETGVLFTRPLGYGDVKWADFFWGIVMLAFCYISSVLPVWRFAQPVNYVSLWFVLFTIVATIVGVVVGTLGGRVAGGLELPAFVTLYQAKLGPIWPILFVTIACGAVSGWHSLVSTSGTARQLEKETDALPVAGGAMYMEGVLATLALVVAASLATTMEFYDPAKGWFLTRGAAGVFALGAARFMSFIGIPETFGRAVAMVFLVVMAVTVMQLVLRFMRVASAELLGDKIPAFQSPHVGSLVAVLLTLFLIVFGFWQWIWVLFGGSNQLFAGMSLLLIAIWMARERQPYNWVYIPGLFMYITTLAALLWISVWNAIVKGIIGPISSGEAQAGFIVGNLVTAAFGLYMFVAAVILFMDALRAFNKSRAEAMAAGD